MRMDWDSGVFTIVPLPIPGGTFNIPGIVKRKLNPLSLSPAASYLLKSTKLVPVST